MHMKYREKFKPIKAETDQSETNRKKPIENIMRKLWDVMEALYTGLGGTSTVIQFTKGSPNCTIINREFYRM